jgi:6-phospho-3-hexuloisomerase
MKAYRDIVLGEVGGVLPRISEADSRDFCRELDRVRRRTVYITGVSRSGLVVHAFGQRLMHLGFDVHLAQEVTAPAIRRGDLLGACSGTGTTLLPLYMARKARKIGARVVSLTASPRSPLHAAQVA